jgi:hypothetical protein
MPFESGSQGSGLLGRVFTAIGSSKKPDIRHTALSPQADTRYSSLFSDYDKLLGAQTSGLGDFTKQYQALTPQLAGLDQLHAATYGKLLDQAQSYDPTKNLTTSGNYLFGNLDKYLNTGLQAGTDAMKRNLAAAGYGDRGPSSYGDILNANRITSNLLPAFSNIVSNLTPLSAQQNADYFRNVYLQPGLMQGQTEALQATPYRALVPSQIQGQQFAGNLTNLGNLTQGQLNNWMFYQKQNPWTTAGNVASGVYGGIFDAADAANKVSSAYSNMMTGGLGGMGGGGQTPNLGGGSNLNTGQFPGEYIPPTSSAVMPSSYPGTVYGGSFGTQAYESPAYGYNPYGLSPYGYSASNPYGLQSTGLFNQYAAQNPYAQYGAYF